MHRRFLPAGAFLAASVLATSFAAFAAHAQTPAAAPPLFAVCQACHESTANAGPSVGPNLFGGGGRKAGTAKDFDYSGAMLFLLFVWLSVSFFAFVVDHNKSITGY